MIRVLLLFLALTGPAAAGAWEEFERRCLLPMENVALAVPNDLDEFEGSHAGMPYREFHIGTDDLYYRVDLGRSDGRDACSVKRTVGGAQASGEIFSQFQQWAKAQLLLGRYEPATSKIGAWVFRSSDWREPKMDVIMRKDESHDGFYLAVWETDLES